MSRGIEMKVVQVTTNLSSEIDAWVDIMEIPETVNNLSDFLTNFNMKDRKVRIVEILETQHDA